VIENQATSMHTHAINIVQSHCPMNGAGIQLSSIPNCNIQNSLIIDIALHMRWQRVNIIYDTTGKY
jgi:hypothetical protein